MRRKGTVSTVSTFSKVSHKSAMWLKKNGVSLLWKIFRFILLVGISYVILYPLAVKFSLVFMDRSNLTDITVKWIPRDFTLENIRVAASIMEYWPTFFRTVGVCLATSLLQVIVCTLSGCGFARFKFRGRGILFALTIATLVIPPQTYIIALYQQFQYFGPVSLFTGRGGVNLINSVWPFILLSATGMGIRSGLYIYILRQSFRGLPKELEEAAYVDGANTFTTFSRVLLPNVIPTVLVAFILSFVWQWNDTFFTTLFAPKLGTMSMELNGIRVSVTEFLGGWQTISDTYTSCLINTGTLLAILPVIVLFIVCQKFFVQGVERTGLVG